MRSVLAREIAKEARETSSEWLEARAGGGRRRRPAEACDAQEEEEEGLDGFRE